MNILFTRAGFKRSGSWQIRGEQIAACLRLMYPRISVVDKMGIAVQTEDIDRADILVIVKRLPADLIEKAKSKNKKIVLDVVDAWPQPDANAWPKEQAVEWVLRYIDSVNPDFIIWPTTQMLLDCCRGFGENVIYHHHRPSLHPIVLRSEVRTVVYEGSPRYIENEWATQIIKSCCRRGWNFHVNPEDFRTGDIGIAVRGGAHQGYVNANWKSNVKLANFHGAKMPCILQREKGYEETAAGGEVFIDDPRDLDSAFDRLQTVYQRAEATKNFYSAVKGINCAANQYYEVFKRVLG